MARFSPNVPMRIDLKEKSSRQLKGVVGKMPNGSVMHYYLFQCYIPEDAGGQQQTMIQLTNGQIAE